MTDEQSLAKEPGASRTEHLRLGQVYLIPAEMRESSAGLCNRSCSL